MVSPFLSGYFLLLFHYLSHTHIDALLSCHRDSSGSCQISTQWGYTAAGVHITSHPTHTRVNAHTRRNTHRLFYFGPLLMARHTFFPFVWCCQRQSHLEYPKLIHSEHQLLAIFSLFSNLTAEPL